MILTPDFFTIPEAGPEDPRAPGNPHNHSARSNLGPNAHRWAITNQFALFH
jgi:hypothetical protein